MMHKFKFVLGDWSHDGHGHTQDIVIEANHDMTNIWDAYLQGCALTGIYCHNPRRDAQPDWVLFTEYEDTLVPIDALERMISFNLQWVTENKEYIDEETSNHDEDTYYVQENEDVVDIIMSLAKLFLHDLTWTHCGDPTPTINPSIMIGYGLFT